jgi:hypothetical protein
MMAKLFFAKGIKIALLMSLPLLASCSGVAKIPYTPTNVTITNTTTTTTTSSSLSGITQLKMFDDKGWATTTSAVLKTSDGGQRWTDVTPTDWEAADSQNSQSTPSDQNNKDISAAFFLDAKDAWIVSSNAETVGDQIVGTALASNSTQTPNIQAQMQVYVRATIDGGSTWMDAHQIQVTNLLFVYPPFFINQHEGWLALTTTTSDGKRRDGHIYHSTDGGIIWQDVSTITGSGDSDSLSGLTMAPNCTANGSGSLPQCTASTTSRVQACTTTGTTNTLGWLAHSNKQSLLLQQSRDSGTTWSNLNWDTPGGAPGQTNDSLIVVSPPIMFADGTGVLPVQMQSNPNGDDSSNFSLHLYKMSFAAGGGASQADFSPTSSFVSQIVAVSYTLSAPDLNHIFVLGQSYNNGTVGRTNLYELSGGNWQTITSQISSNSSTSGSDLSSISSGGSQLSNLDFISDTEGWATSDSALYHITLHGTNATWTQVYPPASTTGTVTVPRHPGHVVSAPANSGVCSS